MLNQCVKNENKHLHVVSPVSIGLAIWYGNHSAAIWKASRGTMRHALLTTSPCCARKAVKHEHTPLKTWRDKIKCSDIKWSKAESIILTIKKWIEVLVAVKVHTGVLATWVINSRWKSSLERKTILLVTPCLASMHRINGSTDITVSPWLGWS